MSKFFQPSNGMHEAALAPPVHAVHAPAIATAPLVSAYTGFESEVKKPIKKSTGNGRKSRARSASQDAYSEAGEDDSGDEYTEKKRTEEKGRRPARASAPKAQSPDQYVQDPAEEEEELSKPVKGKKSKAKAKATTKTTDPSKAKVSHARKTAPGHIKRPPNAFILFRSHCCAPNIVDSTTGAPGTPSTQQLADLGITDHRHISRIVSHLWKSLPQEQKAYWDAKAQEKKEEHQRMYPDYRYKPVYRNKDEVRKRRKGADTDVEEEKRGCEQVAMALMGPQETSSGRWTIDTVAGALNNGDAPPNRKPAKAKPKGKKLTKKQIQAQMELEEEREDELDRETTPEDDMSSSPEPVRIAPPPQSRPTRGSNQLQQGRDPRRLPNSRETYERSGRFDYQQPYGQEDGRPGPSKRLRGPDEEFDDQGRYSYQQAPSNSRGAPPNQRRGVPEPLLLQDPNGAQGFQYYGEDSAQHHYQQGRDPRSADPIGALQRYEFGAGQNSNALPSAMSPGTIRNGSDRLSRAQAAEIQLRNRVFEGMVNRGTFSRTVEGGNLMLVSPCGEGMGFRKFSIGVWEMKDGVETGVRGEQFSELPITAFAFNPETLLSMVAMKRSNGKAGSTGFYQTAPTEQQSSIDALDALLLASNETSQEEFMTENVVKDEQSEGSGPSDSAEAALVILERSGLQPVDSNREMTYIYLMREQAEDPVLVDSLLKLVTFPLVQRIETDDFFRRAFGIAYDHVEQ